MKQLTTGALVTLEGIEGCGKTTLASALNQLLAPTFATLVTKEPGDTTFGSKLRTIAKEQQPPLDARAEFLLYAADRAQHVCEILKPALAARKLILCDRMADSSLVYQGYCRGLSLETIHHVNAWVLDGVKPLLTLYLRLTPEIAHQRLIKRGSSLTAFYEAEDYAMRDWLNLMHTAFQAYEQLYANRNDVCILDATQPVATLAAHARDCIIKALKHEQHIV